MLDQLRGALAARFISAGPNGAERYDGHAFERLCGIILRSLYGEGWTATPAVNDEGRDFERLRQGIEWAECKIHRRDIGLQAVGSTLVMALVESVQKLVILSFSPLSREARRRVFRFASTANCAVELVDGDYLIRLIVGIPSLRRVVFPHLTDADASALLGGSAVVEVESQLTRDAYAYKIAVREDEAFTAAAQSSQERDLPHLQVGATFALDIFLRHAHVDAQTPTSTVVNFAIEFEDRGGAFLCPDVTPQGLNRKIADGIRACEPRHVRLVFRVAKYEPVACLPTIHVRFGDTRRTLPERRLRISALPFTASVVGAASQMLDQIREQLDGQDGLPPLRIVSVNGRSGVGKSRLLQEVAILHLRHGYDNCLLNGEEYRSRGSDGADAKGRFGRLLLSRLFDLPLVEDEVSGNATVLKTRPLLDNTYAGLAEGLLYRRRVWRDVDIDDAAKCCAWRLVRRPILLLLDNVQCLGDDDIRLLKAITRSLADLKAPKAKLYFVFNDDLMLPGSEAAGFRQYLAEICKRPTPEFDTFPIGDLAEDHVETFLNAVLSVDAGEGCFTQAFPKVTARLKTAPARRPLYLLNLLLWLEQKHLLLRDGARFRPVPGRGEFHEQIGSLPDDTRALLDARWALFLSSSNAAPAEDLAYLVSLFDRVPGAILRVGGIPDPTVDGFERMGFLKRDGLNDIAPWHGEVFRYFADRYPLPAPGLAARLIGAEGLPALLAYPAQFYLVRRAAGEVPSLSRLREAGDALAGLTSGTAPADRRFLTAFIDDLLEARTAWASDGEADIGLDLAATALDRLSRRCSADTLARPLARVREHFEHALASPDQPGRGLTPRSARALHTLCNVHFARSEYAPIHRFLLAARSQKERFSGNPEPWVKLVNRLSVAEMWLNRREEALARAAEVLAAVRDLVGDECRSRVPLIEAEIDLGNVYATLLPERPGRAVEHWRAARDAYEADQSLSDLAPGAYPNGMVQFYDALRLALAGQHADARKLALGYGRWSCDASNLYHGVRCLMFAAITHFLAGTQLDHADEVRDILDEACDWCAASGIAHAEWGIHALYGRFAFDQGRYDAAAEAYAKALETFQATAPPVGMLEVRVPFLEELAIRARQLTPLVRSGTATDAVGRLTRWLGGHRRAVPTLRTITTASDDAFDAFLRGYRAACIFHDRGLFVPYQ